MRSERDASSGEGGGPSARWRSFAFLPGRAVSSLRDGHHLPVVLVDVVVVILAVCAVDACGVALEEQLAAISATTGARATFETSFPISQRAFTADSRASY
jgi:hypothetical protein